MTTPIVPAVTDELIAGLEVFALYGEGTDSGIKASEVEALLAERADLKRKLAAASIDAERYRWLRSPAAWNGFQLVMEKGGVNLDAAIDAAKGET